MLKRPVDRQRQAIHMFKQQHSKSFMVKQDVVSYTDTCCIWNQSQVSSCFRRWNVAKCIQDYLDIAKTSSCSQYETSPQVMRDEETLPLWDTSENRHLKKKNGYFALVCS